MDGDYRSRMAPWGIRRGVRHVVLHAAPVGPTVLQVLACGASTIMCGLEITTWYGARYRKWKLCRKCVGQLRKAGFRGRIERIIQPHDATS